MRYEYIEENHNKIDKEELDNKYSIDSIKQERMDDEEFRVEELSHYNDEFITRGEWIQNSDIQGCIYSNPV